MMKTGFGTVLALMGAVTTAGMAAEMLPAKSLPLSKVLATLEQQGLTSIVEADFDNGIWEIEGMRGDRPVELHVDPLTGKSHGEHPDRIDSFPPAGLKSAAAIAKSIEAAGYAAILELDWEHDHWEAEAISAAGHRKLHVAPDTGKVISDRADD
ncbi:PepSY domain-containing protein [Planctomicrobium sp. SH661]|uniref:PepSY domain-containing protein n=1 Tax=Planctomicrobium sp. SH661 TaxID=3448124 RepID=UPI003F5C421D